MIDAPTAFRLDCARPLLLATFPAPQRMVGWALQNPGFVMADRVAWLEVRDADLPTSRNPALWLTERLSALGAGGAVGMMTARNVALHHVAMCTVEGVRAECVVTAGLSNAERIGRRFRADPVRAGTINILCHVSVPLTDGALIEALALVVQARTVAILEAGHRPVADVPPVTGTGTDCVVMAAPCPANGTLPAPYAGMHTAIGEAIGHAAFAATAAAVSEWIEAPPGRP
ncbi:adenosylcobinamide amidohydrolase [Aquabacter spiritensis]|uniref:Adenosylcobinamide hydrolase n=1 Tax=Aquabacter spiritensis TaxID=933073 RepID=A0A4R3LRR2_9HYPH|nr:adenosylcobinamide amidohydrolase [Aquabacter spiritensis]TCT02446.1 adenosylcobinamide hydrolase [Aquabacter spiritensis]